MIDVAENVPSIAQYGHEPTISYLPTLVANARLITVDAYQCGTIKRALCITREIHTEMLG
jgi:hypothetical protein